MNNFTGMDIPAVRNLSRQFQTRADEIRTLTQQLTGQLTSTPWIGADREQFHGEWTGQYTTALNNVVLGLENASAIALKNSNEQEQASAH
jgi:uncharacterized protein YukE